MQPLHSTDGFDYGKLDADPPAASGAQFRAVIDNLSQGLVIVDRESETLYWNPAGLTMHGFANPEAAKGRLHDLPGIFEVSTLEGAVLGLNDWPLARLLRGELIGEVKLRVRRRDSNWSRVFQYSGAQVPYAGDRSLAFLEMTDITELRIAEEAQMRLEEARRQAQEVARRERIFSSALIESMPGIFYFLDERGKMLRWNQNFMNVSGYSADEIANMHASEFFTTEQKERAEETLREAFAHGEASLEGDFRFKDANAAPYFFTGKRLVVDGIVGLVGMGIDISARTNAEAEVRRLNAELEQRVVERTAQLEAANRDLEAFSYSVSHDLRAPLRTVNGYAEIVLADFGTALPEEGRRLLKRIRSRGLYMGVLIDDLLEFSRLGRKPLKRREVDVRSLAESILRGTAPQTEGRRIEFNLGDLPPCYGDASLLRQVWVNLVSNAIKYSRGRDPAIVDIGSTMEKGARVYFVRDNGVGFDMRFVDKIFGVFQRLHLADEFEGTGVGLAIVQRIVERHGGKVWAAGKEQHGATFYFSLPPHENQARQ